MIVGANGPFVYDSEGNELLDPHAAVVREYRSMPATRLRKAAYEQMKRTSLTYNSFFRCRRRRRCCWRKRLARIRARQHETRVVLSARRDRRPDDTRSARAPLLAA